ncbi:MAG TPA: SMP-30/gluconolactonase/LRE family protein [Stellaceae bacterium]|jgi:sugar lactone lactonase YvrE|nr:SMP-30/gluconolactonase/LRE family protein [Stellaceae bacterium]
MSWHFERVAGPHDGHTGGVVWDGGAVIYSAVLEAKLYRYDPANGVTRPIRAFTNRVNGLGLSAEGTLYGSQEGSRRIIEMMPDGSAIPLEPWLGGARINYPCDLTVDSHGRIWFADPYNPLPSHGPQVFPDLPHASVLRLEHHPTSHAWRIKRMTLDTKVPRCVALSPDERTLYVGEGDLASEGARELRAYPINAEGMLEAPRLLHSFARDQRGSQRGAEGIAIDAEGNLVVCAGSDDKGPGALIYVFSSTGRVIESHPFPGGAPMRCAFGGADRNDLYVTSATGGLWRAARTGRTGYVRPFVRH